MIDNYRWALGDQPEPLLEAIETWPGSTGLAGWAALEHISVLLEATRAKGIPAVHVTGLSPSESGVPGWHARIRGKAGRQLSDEDKQRLARKYEIVEQAAPIEGEAVLKKATPSAFFGTPLTSHLIALGVDTLIVGGETTSGCVRATVVDAASYSFRVIVPEECVYDRHESTHAINLFDMDQKYADVLPLDDVLTWVQEYEARSG
jgi:nicotinamidase-related amidase